MPDEPESPAEREVRRMIADRRPVAALVEAISAALAFVIFAFSTWLAQPLGVAVAAVLLVVAGGAGLLYGGVPFLQIRVVMSRDRTILLATIGRVCAIVIGMAGVVIALGSAR